jgi:hypothetical protein
MQRKMCHDFVELFGLHKSAFVTVRLVIGGGAIDGFHVVAQLVPDFTSRRYRPVQSSPASSHQCRDEGDVPAARACRSITSGVLRVVMQRVFLGSVSWHPECGTSNAVALLEVVVGLVQSLESKCVFGIVELRLLGLVEDLLDIDSEASVL